MNFSLMFPDADHRITSKLTAESINDLSIDFLLEALTDNVQERIQLRGMMTAITGDDRTIRYRCEVFDDFLRFPSLRKSMSELVKQLADLRDLEQHRMDYDATALWSLMNRLREVNNYIDCITKMKETLDSLDVTSEGMRALRDLVTNIPQESGFDALRADIDEMTRKAQQLKSVTIGVNLDNYLRPEGAGIVSLNDTKFKDSGLMSRFMDFTGSKSELYHGANIADEGGKLHPASPPLPKRSGDIPAHMPVGHVMSAANIETSNVTGGDPLSNAMGKAATDIMRRTVNDIKSKIKKYVDFSGYSLISLMPEILFYIRWAELVEKIKATGMPMKKAEILPREQREIHLKDVYNLKLAINKVNGERINIITNDIDFDDRYRIFILTGPNRGGKTIFTQAVGLAVLLAQWGVYVPAGDARISPCDNIYTHFPADENDTVDLGRLGEESQRLSGIFKVATRYSMLLLNESLATTSVAEGLFIAKDVVKSMRYLGCYSIFNTHMHDLARNLDEMNANEGDSRVESLVTGVHEGHRSFKVAITPPQGTSYAKDIAVRYGVTFDNIKALIDTKR